MYPNAEGLEIGTPTYGDAYLRRVLYGMLGELPPIEYGSDAALLAELGDCVGAESDWNSEASVGAVATEGAV